MRLRDKARIFFLCDWISFLGLVVVAVQVLERLAAPERAGFTVIGRGGERYGKDTTFDSHADPAFWNHGGGRVMNDSDCVIRPGFVVGNSYLGSMMVIAIAAGIVLI
jgi:hypothetical protein